MALLLVPHGARYSLLGTFNDQNVATVLDYIVHANESTAGRLDDLVAVGQRIIDAWCDSVMDRVSEHYVFEELRILDLDSATGPSGSMTEGDSHTLPVAGTLTGNQCSGNVTALVKKLTSGGRGSRPGRIYMPGMIESDTDGNVLTSSYQATLQAGVDQFLSNTTNTGITDVPQSFMTVVHTVDGDYVSNSQVTHLNLEAELATQRRRMGR